MFDFLFEDINKLDVVGICKKIICTDRINYVIENGTKQIETLLPENLGTAEYRFISGKGGFSSINFIEWVAKKKAIYNLCVSTLAVGKKEIQKLAEFDIKKATFLVGTIFGKRGLADSYDYYDVFREICSEKNWDILETNNHSKIILMQTKNNYYVLETSSNLNENPKMEQFCFCDNKELYDFYNQFFIGLKEVINAEWR
jgi:hypothetical protein